MRTIKWQGTITARSSISQTGRETGTTHNLRREALIGPDGKRIPAVPVISGSVIRGDMRRLAAAMMQDAIVGPDGRLYGDVVHAFRTGGSLRETRSGAEVLTGERQAQVRDLLPMLSVFGFSTSGRIVSGRLIVDKALPATKETAYLAEDYGVTHDHPLPSLREIVQNETYTRFADVTDASAAVLHDPDKPVDIAKGSGNMIWAQQSLMAGTVLYHGIELEAATPLEVSFMDELMDRWCKRGRIGAQKARGMGRVSYDYQRTVLTAIGDETEDEPKQDWRQFIREHAEDVEKAMLWL